MPDPRNATFYSAWLICVISPLVASGGLFDLGTLDGGDSFAYGISGDGFTVVGESLTSRTDDGVHEAFVWRRGTGMFGLGSLNPTNPWSSSLASSFNGNTVVGHGDGNQGFIWTDGGMVGNGPGVTFDISGDGSVVLGTVSPFPGGISYLWSQETGRQTVPGFFGTALSGNGRVVVGTPVGSPNRAAKWTEADGIEFLAPDTFFSSARAITPDGRTIVGQVNFGDDAFRWTESGGFVELGFTGIINDVSGNGEVIVGSIGDAMIWTNDTGPVVLADVLAAQGDDLSEWLRLTNATAISDDGSTIAGWGFKFDPSTGLVHDRAFVATLEGIRLPGDANGDGVVDVSDFNVWNQNKFTPCNLGIQCGDFNTDEFVDVSDFNIWNANKFTGGAAAVPEPATLTLLVFGIVGLLRLRKS